MHDAGDLALFTQGAKLLASQAGLSGGISGLFGKKKKDDFEEDDFGDDDISEGDFTDPGEDNNNDGDFDDPGVDVNGNGDYTDEGDTPPDVAPDSFQTYYQT